MNAPRLAPLVAVVLAACGGESAPLDGALVTTLDAAADVASAADGSDVIAVDLVLPLEAAADVPPARGG